MYGASAEDMDRVSAVLQKFGLTVEQASSLTRSIRFRGTAQQIEAAFHPGLGMYRSPKEGEFRGREGDLEIPAELDGLITGVFGLDQRRVARRMARTAPVATPQLTPADLENRYNFPSGQAAGQKIAIAEFGGAYFPEDLQAFCAKEGRHQPTVTQVPVGVPLLTLDDIRQMPKRQRMAALDESIEVNMDVQIIAGLCPDAEIVLYFASWDEKGWVDLVNQVIGGTPASTIALSISWGEAEDAPDWSAGALEAINERLQAASVLGITICVAAGDDGSGAQLTDGRAHVNFPASSPFVLSVGGTMLDGSREIVWWEAPGSRTPRGGGSTGGGVSVLFNRPAWQTVDVASINAGSIDGRVVPDVAALAGPPLYDMIFMGQPFPGGGTSASAPLWASLIARIAASGTSTGAPRFLTPLIYGNGADGKPRGQTACVDITNGNNVSTPPGQGYTAGPGFDAVSGWGVPNGEALAGSV